MNRRSFLGALVSLVIANKLPAGFDWCPTPKQLEFLSRPEIPMHLWGIPYHESNASTGQWLGIARK